MTIKEMCEIMSEIGKVEIHYDTYMEGFVAQLYKQDYCKKMSNVPIWGDDVDSNKAIEKLFNNLINRIEGFKLGKSLTQKEIKYKYNPQQKKFIQLE